MAEAGMTTEELKEYVGTPYPGTESVTPEALRILDALVGTGIENTLLEAEAEGLTSEQIVKVANSLQSAGNAFLELGTRILPQFIQSSVLNSQAEPISVEGLSFNEDDVRDLDIAFSMARDAMRALGWNGDVLNEFAELQERLRVVMGA